MPWIGCFVDARYSLRIWAYAWQSFAGLHFISIIDFLWDLGGRAVPKAAAIKAHVVITQKETTKRKKI